MYRRSWLMEAANDQGQRPQAARSRRYRALAALLGAVAVLLALALGPLALWGGTTRAQAGATVRITAQGIDQVTVTIAEGETVTWVNETGETVRLVSGEPYRVYLPLLTRNSSAAASQAFPASPPRQGGQLQNEVWGGSIPPGGQYQYTFATTGTYAYFVSPRLGWRGQVIVQEAAPPPPASGIMGPPLDQSVATNLFDATRFLYTDPSPIQTGVVSGTIAISRTAVLRGRTMTGDGQPLQGVTITILDHPEYGQTRSRENGMFDLVVNGGGSLVAVFKKDGFLTVQRRVQAPVQDYAWIPEVTLVQRDAAVTAVDFAASVPVQVVRGSVVSDGDGARQGTLLIAQGTQVTLTLPGGATQAASSLNVRVTEYTVGERGPSAMPAELPANSGYTYAMELSADEADALGATNIQFSQPLFYYVEDFVGFPVGGIVPVGYYDRSLATWVPSQNGRVVKIVSISGSTANLDTNGDGLADDAPTLAALNVSDAERERLAALYQAGQSLWRVPITHFTPWDLNWPYGPPRDAEAPKQGADEGDSPDEMCEVPGSIIGCQSQTLGQEVSLVNTPFRLRYSSDRVFGRRHERTVRISLSGPTVPPSLKAIRMQVLVAGQWLYQSFPPAPNQAYTFVWDGRDAYGRVVEAPQRAAVRIGYVYDAVYGTPAQLDPGFGRFGGAPIEGVRGRQEFSIWQEWDKFVGSLNATGLALGGWTLDVHHAYAPAAQVLYLGNGRSVSARSLGTDVKTVAGTGVQGSGGDGGPAVETRLLLPGGVAVGPDGSIYIADSGQLVVRRVGLDGLSNIYAGTGNFGYSGDGGPAAQAKLTEPRQLAFGPDGSLYIVDIAGNVVRRVGPDGTITTVAGTGRGCPGTSPCGDGGPATAAELGFPNGIALGPDGSIYIADQGINRIRRVAPGGTITTVAGTGASGYGGDGGPATQAQLASPLGVAVGPDGSIYIADSGNHRIRRVGPGGLISTFAGTGTPGYTGDGGPATAASLAGPSDVVVGPDGAIYMADNDAVVRRVGAEGTITTVAGNGTPGDGGDGGDGGPATSAQLVSPQQLAFGPGGSMYIVTSGGDGRVRRVGLDGIITTVAGTNGIGYTGDGGPATKAQLNEPFRLAAGPDGGVYFADRENRRVRRLGPDGIITTVAGNGTQGYSGDGGPATQAQLDRPQAVALGPDGSVYIADPGVDVVRRVNREGTISTLAGTCCVAGYGGDGGPAAQAQLFNPDGVAAGPDGSVYIADRTNQRIRRVGLDGIIVTIAGTGVLCADATSPCGDGGQAAGAQFSQPFDVAMGPDGSLYVADANNNRVRRIGPDGIIRTAAGTGVRGFLGDGGPATLALLNFPQAVSVGPDGSLYIADNTRRIRRVGPEGVITTVAGGGNPADGIGDGGSPLAAILSFPQGVAVGWDGLYVADTGAHRVRRVGRPLPGVESGDSVIAAPDGSEVYHFDQRGRHLRTLHALTGAVLYRFFYDSEGRLTSVADGDGNVTTIERAVDGRPTGILSPYGQRTTLALNASGYLSSITNPAGESILLGYGSRGLLTGLTDPRASTYRYGYDAMGLLTRAEDPSGAAKTLARTSVAGGYVVTVTTPLGRMTTYEVTRLSTGDRRQVRTDPSGARWSVDIRRDGTETATFPDGTRIVRVTGPDSRWGMQAPRSSSLTVTTPGGRTAALTKSRGAVLAEPGNALALTSLTDGATLNGRTFTSRYDAASRTITTTTPAGRQTAVLLDGQGRIIEGRTPGMLPVRFTYDSRGRLTAIARGSRQTTLTFNGEGRVSGVTDALGRTTGLAYDAAGRVVRKTFPDGRQVSLAYDANGNATAVTPPGGVAHRYARSPLGLVEAYIPPDAGAGANQTGYGYDQDRQISQVTRPDGLAMAFQYDQAGRPSSIQVPDGNLGLSYHPTAGFLTALTGPYGGGIAETYDGDLLTNTTWTGPVAGRVDRTYDNNLRLASQSVNSANAAAFQYDPDGLLIQAGVLTLSRDPANGFLTGTTLATLVDTLSYDEFGRRVAYGASRSGTEIYAVQYTRDAIGRIVEKTETVAGVIQRQAYSYDLAGRLVEVRRDGTVMAQYTYDANGNRLSESTAAGTTTARYDAQDRLLAYGTKVYTYTANGELASVRDTATSGTALYRYDVLGNLLASTLPDGTTIEYLVDGLGRRIGKKVNGSLVQGFLYGDQLNPVAELDGSGNVAARFVYATRTHVPDYMVKGGQTYRVIVDQVGSVRLVLDAATGGVAQRLDYDAFGRVLVDTSPGFQPFGYAGGLYDRHTRLTRMGARDYDAEAGRWTAKDPIRFAGGDTNFYVYAGNDPVNRADPSGLQVSGDVDQIIADIIAVVSADEEFVGRAESLLRFLPVPEGWSGGIRNGMLLYCFMATGSLACNPQDQYVADMVCTGIAERAMEIVQQAIQSGDLQGIAGVDTISRTEPIDHTALMVELEDGTAFVLDWHATLDPSNPVLTNDVAEWLAGAN